jgi:NACHT domain
MPGRSRRQTLLCATSPDGSRQADHLVTTQARTPTSWLWGAPWISRGSCCWWLRCASMTSHARSTPADAAAAFVSWLVTAGGGPALVALPVNLVAHELAKAAGRWFRRFRQTDDLSRLVKGAAGTSVQLSRDEIRDLRKLLEEEQTWSLLAGGTLNELKAKELTDQIAARLPQRDGRTEEDSREAAGAIACGLLEFAVFELEPEIFQKVVLARLQQMSGQASALNQALFRMHKDLYHQVEAAKELFILVMDRLPPGRADLNEIKIYLGTLINWLNRDPWPTYRRLRGTALTPADIEHKLRVSVTGPAGEQDADADELARQCARLVILGGPGSGKTWLAKRTARICAEQALAALEAGAALDEVELPLYTTCSRLASTPHGDIREAAVSGAVERIGDLGGSRIVKSLRLFFTERTNEPTLLVIDSLDESREAGEARDRLREADSLRPRWRVVLTSRPSSWDGQLTIEETKPDHRIGELQLLSYPDDVELIIGHWFADEPDYGQDLAAVIARQASLQQASTVPLILAFYCILSRVGVLPEFRRDLYQQVINRMLYSPWRRGSVPPPDPDACRAALRTWAWEGAGNHPVSCIGQWEDDIPTRRAALSPAGQDAVDHIAAPLSGTDFDTDKILRRFVHRSIREHLVAEHIAGLSTDQTATELLPHLWYDSDWEYIAPAAIAMHPKRDEVLRALLCRASRSGELPSDLSVIDATGEVRKLLARVAAQSRQDDWSPGVGTIIGQARVKLVQTSLTADLAEAAHWPTSNRQVRQALLRQLTGDSDGGKAARLAGTLAQLDPTADEKRQARAALLQQLTYTTSSHVAAELTGELARLDPTAEDKRQARDAVLRLLAGVGWYSGRAAALLARTLARVDPTAEDEIRQALETLTRETGSREVPPLAAPRIRPGPTAEERRQAQAALLEQLTCETNIYMAADLANKLARLDLTAEDKRQARAAVLRLLAQPTISSRANALRIFAILAGTLARLDPTADELRQARETLLQRLARETRSDVARSLASSLAQLNPTAVDLSSWWAWAVSPTVEMLAAVRRNSTLEEWLEVLPSLSPLSA